MGRQFATSCVRVVVRADMLLVFFERDGEITV